MMRRKYRPLFLLCASIAVFIVYRNASYMLELDTMTSRDDVMVPNSIALPSSSVTPLEAVLRQPTEPGVSAPANALPSSLLPSNLLPTSPLLVDSKVPINESVVAEQLLAEHKAKTNHTMLKANMSHVGAIVREMKQHAENQTGVDGNSTAPMKILKPHPFKYLINSPDICKGLDIFAITYIHTAPDHHKRRTIIRQTWGDVTQYDVTIRLVFVMGVVPGSKSLSELNATDAQRALYFEADEHRDIVQEDFDDTYHNLTHKGVTALKWITNYCSHAKYVIKTDDDIFVNTFSLIRHLKHLWRRDPTPPRGVLLCCVWYGMPVMRTGKWKVTKEEWPEDYYPTYCSGSAFYMTTDAAISMYRISYYVPFFWVDDFYITGLLPLKAGDVEHVNFGSAFVLNGDLLEEKFTGAQWYSYVFSHVHNLDRIQNVWNKLVRLAKGQDIVAFQTALPGHLPTGLSITPRH